MNDLLKSKEYDFVNDKDKQFIVAFDSEMQKLGYTCNRTIGEGYCWGKNMIIYTKAGVKSKKSYARIYLRDNDLILRMYFSNVNSQKQAIEQAPDYIQHAFTGNYGACKHCHNMKEDGTCSHRKAIRFTINNTNFVMVLPFGSSLPTLQEYRNTSSCFLPFIPIKSEK